MILGYRAVSLTAPLVRSFTAVNTDLLVRRQRTKATTSYCSSHSERILFKTCAVSRRFSVQSSPSSPSSDSSAPPAAAALALPPFLDQVLRGAGQVVFCDHPISGVGILTALFYAQPWLGALASLGTVTSTAVAKWMPLVKQCPEAVKQGLTGYNGCLVGCAVAVFLNLDPVVAAMVTVAGSVASVALLSPLKTACGSVPQWTISFNLATLSMLQANRLLTLPSSSSAAEVVDADVLSWGLYDYSTAVLTGVSQIFVASDALSGAGLLAALAVCSPIFACMTAWGSCMGMGTALAMGAPPQEILDGLWGYNAALTSLSVVAFFPLGASSFAIGTGGAIASTLLFAGMKGSMALPCLTLPFCAVATGCHLIARKALTAPK